MLGAPRARPQPGHRQLALPAASALHLDGAVGRQLVERGHDPAGPTGREGIVDIDDSSVDLQPRRLGWRLLVEVADQHRPPRRGEHLAVPALVRAPDVEEPVVGQLSTCSEIAGCAGFAR